MYDSRHPPYISIGREQERRGRTNEGVNPLDVRG
jgi:hypothetical protein